MKLSVEPNLFKATKGEHIDLSCWSTEIDTLYTSSRSYRELLAEHIHHMKSYQERLYASNKCAVLIIFQAMDAAGKDSVIKHVMSGVNPQGCKVVSFKAPSKVEAQHDFLWRAARCLPERGQIGIFNRSYYEDVLIARVHSDDDNSLGGMGVGQGSCWQRETSSFWQSRYRSIRGFEEHLQDNGTRVIKIFLHVSEEKQKKRLLARIDDPNKHWKFSADDLSERKLWGQYMSAYEYCFCETSTDNSPWYVVPADNKKNARLIVSQILCDRFQQLDLNFPTISSARKRELVNFRKQLTNG